MNKFDQFKKLQFRVLNFIFVEYIHKNNNAYICIYIYIFFSWCGQDLSVQFPLRGLQMATLRLTFFRKKYMLKF
jgi:hypothetical protein